MTPSENPHKIRHARVAELADALDLGSSGLNRRGSNPLSRISFDEGLPIGSVLIRVYM